MDPLIYVDHAPKRNGTIAMRRRWHGRRIVAYGPTRVPNGIHFKKTGTASIFQQEY
jgi:hypothetical protein